MILGSLEMLIRGQMSASLDKVRSAEPSSLHTLVVHRSDGQPKKRKSAASRASANEKRMCYNAAENTQNTLDDMSSAFKFKTMWSESSNETMLYQKCLKELQNLEELDDDAEFAKAVNVLKDDKNANAFTTIKGPWRLVCLRSLWQAL